MRMIFTQTQGTPSTTAHLGGLERQLFSQSMELNTAKEELIQTEKALAHSIGFEHATIERQVHQKDLACTRTPVPPTDPASN